VEIPAPHLLLVSPKPYQSRSFLVRGPGVPNRKPGAGGLRCSA
jgi:hypothetical protein